MMTVAEINDIKKLSAFRCLWKELWQKTAEASFFERWEWLEGYWRRFGAGQQLRVLIVSVGGHPIGLVPLVVKWVPTRLGPVRALTYPLDSWGAFYGPLGPHPAATLAAALKHIRQTHRDWDILDLRYVDTDLTDSGRTQNAMRGAGFQTYCRRWYTTPICERPSSWAEFCATRPDRVREAADAAHSTTTRRRVPEPNNLLTQCAQESNKLVTSRTSGCDNLSLLRWRPEGAMSGDTDRRWDLFESFSHVAQAAGDRSMRNARVLALLRDLHPVAVDAGMVDLCLLQENERTIGWAYGYRNNGTVQLAHCVVAPDRQDDVGALLFARLLRDGFERGDQRYVWTPRWSDFGHDWRTSERHSYRYTHFPLMGAKAQMLRLNHCLKRWLHLDSAVAAATKTPERSRTTPA